MADDWKKVRAELKTDTTFKKLVAAAGQSAAFLCTNAPPRTPLHPVFRTRTDCHSSHSLQSNGPVSEVTVIEVILQHRDTGKFMKHGGQWGSLSRDALIFFNTAEALRFAEQNALAHCVRAVIRFQTEKHYVLMPLLDVTEDNSPTGAGANVFSSAGLSARGRAARSAGA